MSRRLTPQRLFMAAILLSAPCAFSQVLQGPVFDPADGHNYYLLQSATWSASESEAQALGGTLTTINNLAENTWVFDTFAPTAAAADDDLWIGFYDPDSSDGTGSQHAADFIWIDGEPNAYTNWSPGEPNGDPDLGDHGDYAAMTAYTHSGLTPSDWNDKGNTGSPVPAMGVVEVVPEPTTVSLLALSLPTLLKRRTRRRFPESSL